MKSLHLLAGPAPPGLHDLCRHAQARFKAPIVLITLIDREQQIIKASVGTSIETMPRSHAFCDHLLGSDDVMVVPDAQQDARFAANPLVQGEPFVRFYAGAPLIYSRDIRLGGFCLLDVSARTLSAEDQAELTNLADEAMFCVLDQELRR